MGVLKHCIYVLVKFLFWIAACPIFGKDTVLLAFYLCFGCGAVALSASFFPFGVFDERLL